MTANNDNQLYRSTSDEQIELDRAELQELETLLYRLPDDLVVRGSLVSAAEYRVRASAALRAMADLLTAIQQHPLGVSRAKLVSPLRMWRTARAVIRDRLRQR